jgi:hypothetical protein
MCAGRGDSGGPVVVPSADPARVFATGTMHGINNGHCPNQLSYFAPISPTLVRFGLTLTTG